MSTVNSDIRRALVQGVLSCAIGLPTAWPNLPFPSKPANGAPWAGVNIVPSEDGVRAASLGDAGDDRHVGMMQVDVNYPLHQGEDAPIGKIDLLANYFRGGVKLTHGLARVTIKSSSRVRGREVDGFYRMSLTVYWEARVPRNP